MARASGRTLEKRMDELIKNLNEVLAKSKDGFTCYWVGQALAKLSAAAPQVVADERAAHACWSCKKPVTMAARSNADGDCPNCGAELDLEDWPIAAAPVQAQEPVAYIWSVNGMVKTGCDSVFDDHEKFYRHPAPVQTVAVPDGWPTDEMVIRGAEQLQDCLRGAGVVHDFDADLKGTEIQQDIAESVFKSMLELAAPAAQGDALNAKRYEFLRAVGPEQQNIIAHYAMEEMDKVVDAAIAAKAVKP